MKELQDRMRENGVLIELNEDARKWLASIGYDPAFGARPLRRALQKYIESPLSNLWLAEEVRAGDTVFLSKKEGADELELEIRKPLKAAEPETAGALEAPEKTEDVPENQAETGTEEDKSENEADGEGENTEA